MKVYRLGKLEAKKDPRTLKLAKYLRAPVSLPSAPALVSWANHDKPWGMMLNDQIGDCTYAAAGHMIQQWSGYAKPPSFQPTDDQILNGYEAGTGYNPAQPNTDRGAVMLDVLNQWRQDGIAGHKILAYAQVNFLDLNEVRAALEIFGNLYVGIQLPNSASSQANWTVPPGGFTAGNAPGSWGGHCIPLVWANTAALNLRLGFISWGSFMRMSLGFWQQCVDECYAILSPDWIRSGGFSPSRLDVSSLTADLALIT